MLFQQRLRDIREDNDKTQTQIAEILGTTRQQYSRWESGAWQMPIENYKILAEFYNISIDYLAGLIDTPHRLH
ncbi:MAG: helix-turn-helix transcriptional regulator [Clostridia bacterium]|nr:helix-turn-helix transcriptional regulator [Clostridia bacterium]MBR6620782.1 helix-turn-helix transcriptional regulator [Clostridia bacterium]